MNLKKKIVKLKLPLLLLLAWQCLTVGLIFLNLKVLRDTHAIVKSGSANTTLTIENVESIESKLDICSRGNWVLFNVYKQQTEYLSYEIKNIKGLLFLREGRIDDAEDCLHSSIQKSNIYFDHESPDLRLVCKLYEHNRETSIRHHLSVVNQKFMDSKRSVDLEALLEAQDTVGVKDLLRIEQVGRVRI